MKRHLPLLLLGLLRGLPWSSLRAADDAEAKAVAFVEKMGGMVERHDKAKGKPVRGVDLALCCETVTHAGLKEVAALKQLQKLDLTECFKLTDVGLKELAVLKQLQSLNLRGC